MLLRDKRLHEFVGIIPDVSRDAVAHFTDDLLKLECFLCARDIFRHDIGVEPADDLVGKLYPVCFIFPDRQLGDNAIRLSGISG